MRSSKPYVLGALAFAGLAFANPAEAAIRCDGPWQIVSGQRISTPYCGDTYLARVAREYGMRVSARAVRNSTSVKQEVCRLVGHDNRVHDVCIGYLDERDNDRGSRSRR